MSTGDPLLDATISGLNFIQKAVTDTICQPDATRKRPCSVQDLDSGFALTPPEQLPEKQVLRYLASGGTECPNCHSSDITGSQFDVDAGCCWQNISCNECGAEWTDEYELTTVTGFRFGVKSTTGGQTIDT